MGKGNTEHEIIIRKAEKFVINMLTSQKHMLVSTHTSLIYLLDILSGKAVSINRPSDEIMKNLLEKIVENQENREADDNNTSKRID